MNTFQAFWWLALLVGWLLPLCVAGAIFESRPGRLWIRRLQRLSDARRSQAQQYVAVDYAVKDDYVPRRGWLVPR